jgi:hypothetical protein
MRAKSVPHRLGWLAVATRRGRYISPLHEDDLIYDSSPRAPGQTEHARAGSFCCALLHNPWPASQHSDVTPKDGTGISGLPRRAVLCGRRSGKDLEKLNSRRQSDHTMLLEALRARQALFPTAGRFAVALRIPGAMNPTPELCAEGRLVLSGALPHC